MHPAIENFLERPLSHKIAFWVVSLALVAGLFWMYILKSGWEERQDLGEKIADLERQEFEQRELARKLPEVQKEVEHLDNRLNLLLRELPDSKEIANLLTSISTLAVDTGLEVMKFSPGKEQVRDFFAEIPVAVELEGTFHQLATFFDEVGHLSRIVNISEIAIDILSESKQEVLIRATCLITAFRYLDEAERLQARPAAPAGRRTTRKRKVS